MDLDDGMTATQEAAFEIIATVGTAKSMYIGAIQKAKAGDIERRTCRHSWLVQRSSMKVTAHT